MSETGVVIRVEEFESKKCGLDLDQKENWNTKSDLVIQAWLTIIEYWKADREIFRCIIRVVL